MHLICVLFIYYWKRCQFLARYTQLHVHLCVYLYELASLTSKYHDYRPTHGKYWEATRAQTSYQYKDPSNELNIGSNMSALVLLILGKKDYMRGLPSILSLFRNEFDKFNETGARMLEYIYHMTLK